MWHLASTLFDKEAKATFLMENFHDFDIQTVPNIHIFFTNAKKMKFVEHLQCISSTHRIDSQTTALDSSSGSFPDHGESGFRNQSSLFSEMNSSRRVLWDIVSCNTKVTQLPLSSAPSDLLQTRPLSTSSGPTGLFLGPLPHLSSFRSSAWPCFDLQPRYSIYDSKGLSQISTPGKSQH